MRTVALLLSLLIGHIASPDAAQRGAQPAATRAGVAMTVTDMRGATLPGVQVELFGPTDRRGETDASGQLNFPGLQAGTYRLRFTGDAVITFEREVALRAGQVTTLDISLAPAPERAPEAAVAPAADDVPVATGQPQTLSIVDVLEREFVGREPRRETLLSCSGTVRTVMIQLNEPQPERLYDTVDVVYYVLGGQGTVRLDGRETRLNTNDFASVPRGTAHAFERRGNRALVLLAVLGGTPCEETR